ncbi:hypothetical protein DICVIV_07837 [Dictyocaulus viviparus]|uniref:RRM domain-containing protein n=1 Tax=Dictyocaulus viviparus TaxID=29172 RepID=A0A0D8XNH6_DICVI|nr:hypothetical protein DICVIV_07837 [Dictyocaulus viviparus]
MKISLELGVSIRRTAVGTNKEVVAGEPTCLYCFNRYSAYKRKQNAASADMDSASENNVRHETVEKKRKIDPEYRDFLEVQGVKIEEIVRGETRAVAFVTFNRLPDVRRALQRNQDYIGGYKLTISKAKVDNDVSEATVNDNDTLDNRETEEARIREELLETGRIFVRNLPFTTKEEDLHFLFKKFGEIAEIQGRMMHILPGSEKREETVEENLTNFAKTSYKKMKFAKLKANAGKVHSWNSLFLGSNAVADTLAERLGIEKGELLNSETGESNMVIIAKNLPANIQVEELRRMFGKYGEVEKVLMPPGKCFITFMKKMLCCWDSCSYDNGFYFRQVVEYLKNGFLFRTIVITLLICRCRFSGIPIPEHGISAIIAMTNSVDAKKAFQALAYSRLRTHPLYLEWAPGDVFTTPVESKLDVPCACDSQESIAQEEKKKNKRDMTYEEKKAVRKKKKYEVIGGEIEKMEGDVSNYAKTSSVEDKKTSEECSETLSTLDSNLNNIEDDIIEPGSTVFIKNLSFETTDESLAKLFRKKYRLKSAQISKKLNPTDPEKSLSMGFGFVQFYTKAEAQRAIKEMQGELLDGHCLELKISNRELYDKDALKRKSVVTTEQNKCTKLLVRNIPFQANLKELESLFSSFGEVKSIRIPKKVGSRDQHRGFGFVDFISIGEAKRAFESLVHSTHLYGRRLVLEWAKPDDSVQELRAKTAEKFSGDWAAVRKQKKRLDAIEKDLAVIDDD